MLVADPETGGERAKVLDFGLVKLLQPDIDDGPAEGQGLTRTGDVMGTPRYMSPEQCRSARDVDAPTDVYALGVMLYEMLAGEPPFRGQNDVEIFTKHLYREPPPLIQKAPHLDPNLAALVTRMLNKAPESRPTAAEVVTALGRLGDLYKSASLPIISPVAPASSAAAVNRGPEDAVATVIAGHGSRTTVLTGRQRQAAVAVITALVVFVIGGIVLLRQRTGRVPPPPPPVVEQPPVRWTINSSPAGVEVFNAQDPAKPLGRTPLLIQRRPGVGTQSFLLRHPGYAELRVTLDLARDSERDEILTPLPAPPKKQPPQKDKDKEKERLNGKGKGKKGRR